MTTETDKLFDILRGNTFRGDPNQIPQESIPVGGGNAQPAGWYGEHTFSSFIGKTNVLADPGFQSLEPVTAIGTAENTLGSWFVKYVLNSGGLPFDRQLDVVLRGSNANPFNSHMVRLKSDALVGGGAYDIDYYVRVATFTPSSFLLPYLVAALKVSPFTGTGFVNNTFTNITTATLVLEIYDPVGGAVLASSPALDWITVPNNEQRQLVAALRGATGSGGYRLRLHVHIVASAGPNVVYVSTGEPQLHFAFAPDPVPYAPVLGAWNPEQVVDTTGGTVLQARDISSGDTTDRFVIGSTSVLSWGSGAATQDVRLQRSTTKTLTIDDNAGGAATLAVQGALQMAGLTGATAATRYVGATASAAPLSGTFALGDFIIDQTGKVWVCTTGGTPGTWTQVGGTGSSPGLASIVSPVAIANTETVVVSATIAANTMVAGTTYRLKAFGKVAGNTNAMVFRCRIGTTTLTGNIPASFTAEVNSGIGAFMVEVLVTIRTGGTGGTAIGQVFSAGDNISVTMGGVPRVTGITATVVVDTTAQKYIELTFISGNATSTTTFEVATIELVKA